MLSCSVESVDDDDNDDNDVSDDNVGDGDDDELSGDGKWLSIIQVMKCTDSNGDDDNGDDMDDADDDDLDLREILTTVEYFPDL